MEFYAKLGLLAVLLLGLGFLALTLVGIFQWKANHTSDKMKTNRPELVTAGRCRTLLHKRGIESIQMYGKVTSLAQELLTHLELPLIVNKPPNYSDQVVHLFFPSSTIPETIDRHLKIVLGKANTLPAVGVGLISETNNMYETANDEELLTRMFHGEVGATTQAEIFHLLHGFMLWNPREKDVIDRLHTLEHNPDRKKDLAQRGQRLVRSQHTLLNRIEHQLLVLTTPKETDKEYNSVNVVVVSDDYRVMGNNTVTLTWREWSRQENPPPVVINKYTCFILITLLWFMIIQLTKYNHYGHTNIRV